MEEGPVERIRLLEPTEACSRLSGLALCGEQGGLWGQEWLPRCLRMVAEDTGHLSPTEVPNQLHSLPGIVPVPRSCQDPFLRARGVRQPQVRVCKS